MGPVGVLEFFCQNVKTLFTPWKVQHVAIITHLGSFFLKNDKYFFNVFVYCELRHQAFKMKVKIIIKTIILILSSCWTC